MPTLITGITGRVGRRLATHLAAQGHAVRGLAPPSEIEAGATASIDAEIVAGDLSDVEALRAAVDGVDAVVHLAGLMAWGDDGQNDALFDVNLAGTYRLLEAVRRSGSRLRRFVLASSDEVYPSLGGRYLPIDETHPTEPYSLYGLTKLACEDLLRYYARSHGVPGSIARFALVTAPEEVLVPTGWLGRFLYLDPMVATIAARAGDEAAAAVRAHRTGDRTLLLARDETGRPYTFHYVDVRDVVVGLELLLTRPEAIGEAFNLAGPAPFSFEVAVGYLAERTGDPVADLAIPGPPIHIHHSIAKARALLGYAPSHGIVDTIDAALETT
jgi:UDP-glucose 4-epimerase